MKLISVANLPHRREMLMNPNEIMPPVLSSPQFQDKAFCMPDEPSRYVDKPLHDGLEPDP